MSVCSNVFWSVIFFFCVFFKNDKIQEASFFWNFQQEQILNQICLFECLFSFVSQSRAQHTYTVVVQNETVVKVMKLGAAVLVLILKNQNQNGKQTSFMTITTVWFCTTTISFYILLLVFEKKWKKLKKSTDTAHQKWTPLPKEQFAFPYSFLLVLLLLWNSWGVFVCA